MKNKEEGITLVALVVTIVVLLILAGISINLVIGENGIITKAQQARNQTEEAKINTEKVINSLEQELANNMNKIDSGTEKDDTEDYDPASEGVTIPVGFVYVGGTKESGLVISDNMADKEQYKGQETVGTDLQGNQFVWIPVDNLLDYKRTWYIGTGSLSNYSEVLPDDEKTSVEKNKGYYIGRYEAGDQESTNSKTLRTSSSSTTNTVAVKEGQAPYNYVTKTQAEGLAKGFSGQQNYKSVTSKLISSYAWDTTIAFIQKTNSNYGSSSEEGNYKDKTVTYKDIKGVSQTKTSGTETLIPTGQTTAINNIYDMGGNVWEWTTEARDDVVYPYANRGGGFDNASAPAGYRSYNSDSPHKVLGFRITLFL